MGTRRLRLGEICSIRGGYIGPDSTTSEPGPNRLRALQARDVASDGSVAWDTLRYWRPVRDGERYAVSDGDVILHLRGARTTAVAVRGAPRDIIAVGQWALVSPDRSVIEPEFIAWYLNHPQIQTRLSQLTQGTKLQFLSIRAVRDFEIDVPPIAVQRRIARVSALHVRLSELEQRLTHARSQLIDTMTMDALRRAPTPHDTNS